MYTNHACAAVQASGDLKITSSPPAGEKHEGPIHSSHPPDPKSTIMNLGKTPGLPMSANALRSH